MSLGERAGELFDKVKADYTSFLLGLIVGFVIMLLLLLMHLEQGFLIFLMMINLLFTGLLVLKLNIFDVSHFVNLAKTKSSERICLECGAPTKNVRVMHLKTCSLYQGKETKKE